MYNGQLVRRLQVEKMLTYLFVRCAFFTFNSYYLSHSPSFLVYNGQLVRRLQVEKMLTYLFVRCAFSSLKSYYLSHYLGFI